MARHKKHRPTDPAEAARKAYEARRKGPAGWGVNEAAIARQDDIHSEPETRIKARRVFRFDCFTTLKLTDGQLGAVRRLQDDLAIRFGVDGGERGPGGQSGQGIADLVSARSLDAADRIETALAYMDRPWTGKLLVALSMPAVVEGRRANWHAIVKVQTGLTDRDMQSKAVKQASEAMRTAWEAYDNRRAKAA